MKKFRFSFTFALVVMLAATLVWAGVTNFDSVTTKATSDDTYILRGDNSSGTRVFSVASNGAVYISGTLNVSGVLTNARVKDFALPLLSFIVEDPAGTPVYLNTSTGPTIQIDDGLLDIVWADGVVTPVMMTFRVPTDYSSGGAFYILASQSGTSTPNAIDFIVYVNRSGVAFDAASTNQVAVSVGTGGSATNLVVTLTPGTDFSSLAAGDWVTLRLWRDDTAGSTGTDDLEVKGVSFFYTASH